MVNLKFDSPSLGRDGCPTDEYYEFIEAIAEHHAFQSHWSITEVTDFTEVPEAGLAATKLKYDVDAFWGKSVEINLPQEPTWLDLWTAADAAIAKSGDQHHIFIEDIVYKGLGVFELHCGS